MKRLRKILLKYAGPLRSLPTQDEERLRVIEEAKEDLRRTVAEIHALLDLIFKRDGINDT